MHRLGSASTDFRVGTAGTDMRPNSNVSQFRFNSSDGFNNVQPRPTTTNQTNKIMQAIPEVAAEYQTRVVPDGDETYEFGLAADLNQLKTNNK